MNNHNCSTSQQLNNSTAQQFNKLASHPLTNSSTHTLIGRVASLLEVGTGFHPMLSGHENIHVNGAIQGMSKRERDS